MRITKLQNNLIYPHFCSNSTNLKEKSFEQKLGYAAASTVCPGLGQLVKGDGDRGAKFAFATYGSILAGSLAGYIIARQNPTKIKKALVPYKIGLVVALPAWLYGIIDAYKN